VGLAEKHNDTTNRDVVDLVIAYAKQETIEPLRGAGRWILWGLASMVFICGGVLLLVLGALRLSQDLLGSSFATSWSWIPYVLSMCACALVVVIALRQMKKVDL
jgi:hypothetical protein